MNDQNLTRRDLLRSTAVLATSGAGASTVSRRGMADTGTGSVVDIGSRRELFGDRTLVAQLDGLRLELQTPTCSRSASGEW